MRIQELMTKNVFAVSPGTSADQAWNLMRQRQIHHLVAMEGGSVAGVLSDRDIGGRRGAAVRKDSTVADLMTQTVVSVTPTTTVRQAANLMRGRSIGCVVVLDGKRVVGIVTVTDLLELVGRGIDRGATPTKRWTLRHRVPHVKKRRATGVW